jgi:hypothetical protein
MGDCLLWAVFRSQKQITFYGLLFARIKTMHFVFLTKMYLETLWASFPQAHLVALIQLKDVTVATKLSINKRSF